MKYSVSIVLILLISVYLSGCGMFNKKSPEGKTQQQIMLEQNEMKKKIDSLKNIQYDKELDSLRKELDTSEKKLNEFNEKNKFMKK